MRAAPADPLPGKARRTGPAREILRSLNLSTACGIAAYEALRQLHHGRA
jgi:tRNA(Leu) C34 or U34 (ribose-2'-O)-methylase TrmL